jgi:hypothetical protein
LSLLCQGVLVERNQVEIGLGCGIDSAAKLFPELLGDCLDGKMDSGTDLGEVSSNLFGGKVYVFEESTRDIE